MAITTLDQYIAASKQVVRIKKTGGSAATALTPFFPYDSSGLPGGGGANPGNTANGVIPNDSNTDFPAINNFAGANVGYIGPVNYKNSVAGGLELYDVLWWAGGYIATALATTTLSSQPSYASRLPNTDYNGLEIQLLIKAAVSNTATTVTVTYTNESGVTGRSTGAVSIQSFALRRIVTMPLQSGDRGVQKIESVTVGGVVATTGNFLVMVCRWLWANDIRVLGAGGTDGLDVTGMPIIYDSSAIMHVITPDGTNVGIYSFNITVPNG